MWNKILICALFLWARPGGASDWPKYCANLELTGVAQSGGAITPFTAGTLSRKWLVRLGGPIASSPAVASNVVYVGDWSGWEHALAVSDGHRIAAVDLGTTTALQCEPSTLGITSSPAIENGTVFLAGGDESFYALKAGTLEISWSKPLGNTAQGYYGWCSPAVAGGVVLQGISSNCDTPFVAGRVVAMDTQSGNTIDDEFLVKPQWPYNSTGSGVWTSPAVDLDRSAVFVTTGSALDVHDGHSFSLLRLSLQGLRVVD
ncbi:MAG: PQQ-binding-like beta-propeller repeat protein, partial [Thermoanaerobaculia bacterium]